MYFIIATEKYTLNVYLSVTMIMEPVEWVSFVLIMFKVVVLAAFGAVDTANLSQRAPHPTKCSFLPQTKQLFCSNKYLCRNKRKSQKLQKLRNKVQHLLAASEVHGLKYC